MIKTAIRKLFSCSLAVLVLFSTLSFTIEKHYCGDTLIDVAIFSEPDTCGMEQAPAVIQKSCCDDEVNFIKGQNELKLSSFEDLDIEFQLVLVQVFYNYYITYKSLPKAIIPHKAYTPPNLAYNIQKLDQVFLI